MTSADISRQDMLVDHGGDETFLVWVKHQAIKRRLVPFNVLDVVNLKKPPLFIVVSESANPRR